MTKQELLQEYAKCAVDPVYFAEKYCQVFDQTSGGYKSFVLFEKQKELIKAYQNHRFNIVLKPRQAGVSTTSALYCAHTILFADPEKPEKILIVANKLQTAQEFLKKVKSFITSAPEWMFNISTDLIKNNDGYVEMYNGSAAKAVATSEDALRGFTPTIMVMDEAAFIERGAEVWTAALPALSTGGKGLLISTPNGMDELYYKIYDGAKSKNNNFNIVEMRWYEDPRFNKDLKWVRGDETILEKDLSKFKELVEKQYKPTSSWYEQMCRELNNDVRKIAQELDGNFNSSGNNVIPDEQTEFIRKNNLRTPIRTEGFDNKVWIWEYPIEGHKYLAGVDVSRGDSTDYSTIQIVDIDTGHQVLEYQGKVEPDVLGEIAYKYGIMYNAYTIVDITGGIGSGTVIKLRDLGYTNLHYCQPGETPLKNKMKSYYNKDNMIPGFMFGTNRGLVINALQTGIRDNTLKIRSERVINEIKTYVYDGKGRPNHMKGYNDDLLISLAMTQYVMQNNVREYEKAKKQAETILNSIVVNKTQHQSIHEISNPNNIHRSNTITPDAVKQFNWLFK